MQTNTVACFLLTLTLLADSAEAIRPPAPDEAPVKNPMQFGWKILPENFPQDPKAVLMAEARVYSARLGGVSSDIFRIKQKIEGVGAEADTEVTRYIEIYDFNGTRFSREVPPAEIERLKAEGKLSEHGLTAEDFTKGLRAGAAGALVLGAGMETKTGALSSIDKDYISVVADPDSWGGDRYGDCTKLFGPAEGKEGFRYKTKMPDGKVYDQGPIGGDYTQDSDSPSVWASTSPAKLMSGNACFLLFAADAFDSARGLSEEQRAAAAAAYAEFLETAGKEMRYEGKEEVRGHLSHRVGTDKAGITETVDDQQVDLNRMDVWIDAETFVRRKMRFEGVVTRNGESQDFCMERIYDDYRNVPNSTLYEPYQEIISICGLMTPEQKRELQEAEAELADYQSQLAQLPPSQQAMMKRMVEPQIERMRALARGNTVEFEFNTTSIEIGPDFGDPDGGAVVADEAITHTEQAQADAEALQAARQACLEEKIAEAEQVQQTQPGTGQVAGAAARTAMRVASGDVSGLIAGFFVADQTREDIGAIAEVLGLSEEEVIDCQNP